MIENAKTKSRHELVEHATPEHDKSLTCASCICQYSSIIALLYLRSCIIALLLYLSIEFAELPANHGSQGLIASSKVVHVAWFEFVVDNCKLLGLVSSC